MKKPRFAPPSEVAEPTASYASARFACNQIKRCTADLVLVGMPGGQGLLLAAQALWTASQTAPFPPVAMIHLSEQHVDRFKGHPRPTTGQPLLGFLFGIMEAGPYMTWIQGQAAWQAELCAAIERALVTGRKPASVVILGERDLDALTAPLALGLLAAVCPAARASYIAGPGGVVGSATYWPIHFVEEWINGPQAAAIPNLPTSGEMWSTISTDLISLALAGDTAGPETLNWQPITADHPAIERMSAYFTRADLLALPRWTADAFQKQILAQYRAATRPRRRPHTGPKPPKLRPDRLPASFVLGRELWLRRRLTAAAAAQAAGITVEEATEQLERECTLAPDLLVVEDADGTPTYCLRNQAGILAYGSLRADPGPELSAIIEWRTVVTTPFPVEYVRSSPTRADAPVLVPVPAGYGAPAPAEVLALAPEFDRETAAALLQRRKLDRASDDDMWFAVDEEEMPVHELTGFAGLPVVLYAAGAPNLPEVIPNDVPLSERARVLAKLAIASLTPETYAAGHDGICYLADALAQGIITPLTEPYRQAVLRLTGAADLAAARKIVAAQRGITEADP